MQNELVKTNHQLSLWQVVVIGIAYMTPMTVFDTFGIVSGVTHGRVPLTYIFALLSILLTAFSYSRLSILYPNSSSAYAYTENICGRASGFIVGWGTLLDYLLLPMINSLLSGIYLEALFPMVPVWISITLYTMLVTYLNCKNISLIANLNFIFVGVPVLLTIVFIYLVIRDLTLLHGPGYIFTFRPLINGDYSFIPLVSGAAVLCFSFLGFDAVTTLSNETREPKKNIPRAIILTVLIGGTIFFISAWYIQLYYPTNIQFKNPTKAMPEIVLYVGGRLFQSIFLIAILINTFASALASHASAARLLYSMCKNEMIPGKIFQYIHPKYNTPLFCVLFIGFVSLSAVFFQLDTAVSLVSFGAMIAFSAVNISVFILYFFKGKDFRSPKAFTMNIVLPLLGLFTVGIMWCNLEEDSFLLGTSWSIVGIIYLIYCKTRKKFIYKQKMLSK